MKQINILFTSVGRRVELLRCFRKAYESLGLEGKIVALDMDPLAAGLQVADVSYLTPPLGSPDYIETLARILRQENVTAVFPLIDPDIPVLAANRVVLESTGVKLGVCFPEAVKIASDKWLTTQFFQKAGLRTPASWLPEQSAAIPNEYPLFIKPRSGSASEKAFRVDNADQLEFFKRYVPNSIVQEYLTGPEITNDVICDLDGSVLAVVSRQRIRVRAGEVAIGKTILDPRILDACVQLARALPAVGPITVQCMMHRGGPVFTEINARLGGGAPLGIAAGCNWPTWLLARLAGHPASPSRLGEYQTDLYTTRFDDCFFLTEADRERVASHRL